MVGLVEKMRFLCEEGKVADAAALDFDWKSNLREDIEGDCCRSYT